MTSAVHVAGRCDEGTLSDRRDQKDLQTQAFLKRLMGFEPTTFCMASRRSSQLSYSRALGAG
jgi:hypothetical protein